MESHEPEGISWSLADSNWEEVTGHNQNLNFANCSCNELCNIERLSLGYLDSHDQIVENEKHISVNDNIAHVEPQEQLLRCSNWHKPNDAVSTTIGDKFASMVSEISIGQWYEFYGLKESKSKPSTCNQQNTCAHRENQRNISSYRWRHTTKDSGWVATSRPPNVASAAFKLFALEPSTAVITNITNSTIICPDSQSLVSHLESRVYSICCYVRKLYKEGWLEIQSEYNSKRVCQFCVVLSSYQASEINRNLMPGVLIRISHLLPLYLWGKLRGFGATIRTRIEVLPSNSVVSIIPSGCSLSSSTGSSRRLSLDYSLRCCCRMYSLWRFILHQFVRVALVAKKNPLHDTYSGDDINAGGKLYIKGITATSNLVSNKLPSTAVRLFEYATVNEYSASSSLSLPSSLQSVQPQPPSTLLSLCIPSVEARPTPQQEFADPCLPKIRRVTVSAGHASSWLSLQLPKFYQFSKILKEVCGRLNQPQSQAHIWESAATLSSYKSQSRIPHHTQFQSQTWRLVYCRDCTMSHFPHTRKRSSALIVSGPSIPQPVNFQSPKSDFKSDNCVNLNIQMMAKDNSSSTNVDGAEDDKPIEDAQAEVMIGLILDAEIVAYVSTFSTVKDYTRKNTISSSKAYDRSKHNEESSGDNNSLTVVCVIQDSSVNSRPHYHMLLCPLSTPQDLRTAEWLVSKVQPVAIPLNAPASQVVVAVSINMVSALSEVCPTDGTFSCPLWVALDISALRFACTDETFPHTIQQPVASPSVNQMPHSVEPLLTTTETTDSFKGSTFANTSEISSCVQLNNSMAASASKWSAALRVAELLYALNGFSLSANGTSVTVSNREHIPIRTFFTSLSVRQLLENTSRSRYLGLNESIVGAVVHKSVSAEIRSFFPSKSFHSNNGSSGQPISKRAKVQSRCRLTLRDTHSSDLLAVYLDTELASIARVGLVVQLSGFDVCCCDSEKYIYLKQIAGFSNIGICGVLPSDQLNILYEWSDRTRWVSAPGTAPTILGSYRLFQQLLSPSLPLCTIRQLWDARTANRALWSLICAVTKIISVEVWMKCSVCMCPAKPRGRIAGFYCPSCRSPHTAQPVWQAVIIVDDSTMTAQVHLDGNAVVALLLCPLSMTYYHLHKMNCSDASRPSNALLDTLVNTCESVCQQYGSVVCNSFTRIRYRNSVFAKRSLADDHSSSDREDYQYSEQLSLYSSNKRQKNDDTNARSKLAAEDLLCEYIEHLYFNCPVEITIRLNMNTHQRFANRSNSSHSPKFTTVKCQENNTLAPWNINFIPVEVTTLPQLTMDALDVNYVKSQNDISDKITLLLKKYDSITSL